MTEERYYEKEGDPPPLVRGFCPKCNLDLAKKPDVGLCPRCGEPYTADRVLPRPLPSAFGVAVRFGWPLAPLAVAAASHPYFASQYLGEIAWLFWCMAALAVTSVNSVVQTALILLLHMPRSERRASLGSKLQLVGGWAPAWFLGTFVGPFLVVGGCCVVFVS